MAEKKTKEEIKLTEEECGINEETCTCCGKKWTVSKITKITEGGHFTKWLGFGGWVKQFIIVYRLVCTKCNISTDYTKYIDQKDFKPKCESKK